MGTPPDVLIGAAAENPIISDHMNNLLKIIYLKWSSHEWHVGLKTAEKEKISLFRLLDLPVELDCIDMLRMVADQVLAEIIR